MTPIQNKILEKLQESDMYKFIYDLKDMKHKDKLSTTSFYETLVSEIANDLNEDTDVDSLHKIWRAMRDKFVRLNLKLSKGEKLNEAQKNFYGKLEFLENYISHIGINVRTTEKKNECDYLNLIHFFDDLGDYIELTDKFREEEVNYDSVLNEFPDASSIFDLPETDDTTNIQCNNESVEKLPDECSIKGSDDEIEILEGYESIVQELIEKEIIENYIQSVEDKENSSINKQPIISKPVLEQAKENSSINEQPIISKPVLEQNKDNSLINEQAIISKPVLEQELNIHHEQEASNNTDALKSVSNASKQISNASSKKNILKDHNVPMICKKNLNQDELNDKGGNLKKKNALVRLHKSLINVSINHPNSVLYDIANIICTTILSFKSLRLQRLCLLQILKAIKTFVNKDKC